MTEPWIEPPALASVQLGSEIEQACSPPLRDMSWQGVALNAPLRLRERKDAETIVPVCGLYYVHAFVASAQVGTIYIRINGHEVRPQTIGLGNPANEVGPPGPLFDHAEFHGGYFAVDVAPYIAFPRCPAKIEFMIEYGGFRSDLASFDWIPLAPERSQPAGRPAG